MKDSMRRAMSGVAFACLLVSGLMLRVSPARAAETDAAVQLQNAFTQVADKACKAVVVITNKRVEQTPMYPQMPPEFRFFFGIPEDEGQQPGRQPGQRPEDPHARKMPKPVGKGSGIIIRADGYIVTNYHVIAESDDLEVKLSDGRVFDSTKDKDSVKVIGKDEETDVAVLQVGKGELKDLPTLEFADSDQVRIGEWAIAVGAPFNLDYSVTVGVVSQKGRHDVGMTTFENYIQTDASINPGNSGGPLLNIRGDVIGINNFIMTGGNMSRGSIGLGFAIASNLVKQVSTALIENGGVSRPFLGIGMQELTDDLKKQFNVENGVLVSEVMKGDPAEKAGIEPGDVVLKIGDKRVRTPNDLLFAVLAYKPGDKIPVLVDRRGKEQEFSVVARQRDTKDGKSPAIHGQDDLLNELGLALGETDEGVAIAGIVGGSPANAANLRRGDVIIEVNRNPVKKIKDVIDALGKTQNNMAVFYIDRNGAKFFVPLPLGGDGKGK
ncbi:MAG: hypothetical protein A3K19_12510 [Lentisphaerae bacterium RIFOXYB12_FULL_65_16]|nr:MAG: hypothetical protein A3K18_12165 [Lentisphaerae bacterium RIFOXYA12_64_32]OGV88105.1 MAG: hypothetical protein A3K19_12510 [Lentisphaerae bacterium RIFOXYB12_FULL_65_16]